MKNKRDEAKIIVAHFEWKMMNFRNAARNICDIRPVSDQIRQELSEVLVRVDTLVSRSVEKFIEADIKGYMPLGGWFK